MIKISDLEERFQYRLNTEQKHCSGCDKTKSIQDFYIRIRTRKDTGYRFISVREVCKLCHIKTTAARSRLKPNGTTFGRYQRNASMKGFEFSLSRELFNCLMDENCHYCGDRTLKITLDRVDNDVGYTNSNVVPACIRCNLLKGDMPKEAWFALVPHVRSVYESGKFGKWVPRNLRVNARQDITR